MPTFRAQRPPSITHGVQAMLTGGGGLTASDYIHAQQAASVVRHNDTLSEKVRQEMEARAADRAFRENPDNAINAASAASGAQVPVVQQFERFRQGQYDTHPDTGDVNNVQRPQISPEQEQAVRRTITAAIMNRLATGKTSADQLAHAAERTQASNQQNAAAQPGVPVVTQNQLNAASRGAIQEPYSGGAPGGVAVNQVTGEGRVANQGVYDRAAAVARSLEAQHRASAAHQGASAGLASERRTDLQATRPGRIEATAALAANRAAGPRGGAAGSRFTPEQVQRWIDQQTNAEYKLRRGQWDALPSAKRKTTPEPSLDAVRKSVNDRYRKGEAGPDNELQDAHAAIAAGKDPLAVRQRFKERTGLDFIAGDQGE